MDAANKAKAEAMAAAPGGTVPDFATGFAPSIRADGRLWLVGESCGATVAVQPKAWSTMTFSPDGTATAAARPDAGLLFSEGVNLPSLQAHVGQLQTNDPAFGGTLLGTSAECRRDEPCPPGRGESPYLIPAVVLAAGLVAAALVRRFRS